MTKFAVFYVKETGEALLTDPEFPVYHKTLESAYAAADSLSDMFKKNLRASGARFEVRFIPDVKNVPEQTLPIESIPHGEYVKRKADSKKVYIRKEYNRELKKYYLQDSEDINAGIYVKRVSCYLSGLPIKRI